MGILSVVGTPIGNLGDMTYRAVETLEKADFICAEDTRVTAKLLNYFDIKTPLVSYHEHNAKQVGESILNRIMAGENAAIVTDAGMPCISDPGELLVKLCAENGVKVEVVPGPSAVVSALAVSGLDTARFQFDGFLSTTKKQRLNHLASVKNCTRSRHVNAVFSEIRKSEISQKKSAVSVWVCAHSSVACRSKLLKLRDKSALFCEKLLRVIALEPILKHFQMLRCFHCHWYLMRSECTLYLLAVYNLWTCPALW